MDAKYNSNEEMVTTEEEIMKTGTSAAHDLVEKKGINKKRLEPQY